MSLTLRLCNVTSCLLLMAEEKHSEVEVGSDITREEEAVVASDSGSHNNVFPKIISQ